jgi:universal stress protein E
MNEAGPASIGGSVAERRLNRIFVAIADPSAGINKALRRAAALARQSGAQLELFHAMPMAVSAGSARAAAEHFTRLEAEGRKRDLERMANRLRREELIVETTVQTGFPVHEAILRRVRLIKPDLAVIEARKHAALARLLLTQTDFELIRHCPVPLLIVKGKAAWRSPRILAAVDPFHAKDRPLRLDRTIVDVGRVMADAVRGSVHALHVYPPLAIYTLGVGKVPATPRQLRREESEHERSIRTAFSDFMDELDIPRSRRHLVRGNPLKQIPAIAHTMRAGLVVMGAASRSAFKRFFVGNTAEHVLDGLRCDVLVVKAADFQ